MSREYDPLLSPQLKTGAIAPNMGWTDVHLLVTIAKAHEALRMVQINGPRILKDAQGTLHEFAKAREFDHEKANLNLYLQDVKQLKRLVDKLDRTAKTMYSRVIGNRYPENR